MSIGDSAAASWVRKLSIKIKIGMYTWFFFEDQQASAKILWFYLPPPPPSPVPDANVPPNNKITIANISNSGISVKQIWIWNGRWMICCDTEIIQKIPMLAIILSILIFFANPHTLCLITYVVWWLAITGSFESLLLIPLLDILAIVILLFGGTFAAGTGLGGGGGK